jgi:hypothetical protein
MTNTFNTKNFARMFCNNIRSWEGTRIGHQQDTNELKRNQKRKNDNVQTFLMPTQQERKETKLLFGGRAGGVCSGAILEKV